MGLVNAFVKLHEFRFSISSPPGGMRSSGESRPLARRIRQNVATRRSGVIWSIWKGIDRLLTAYQEGLLPIEELRERMPELRRREQASNAELQAIADQSVTCAAYLRLAETRLAGRSRGRGDRRRNTARSLQGGVGGVDLHPSHVG
jgi:hypothetical protein